MFDKLFINIVINFLQTFINFLGFFQFFKFLKNFFIFFIFWFFQNLLKTIFNTFFFEKLFHNFL